MKANEMMPDPMGLLKSIPDPLGIMSKELPNLPVIPKISGLPEGFPTLPNLPPIPTVENTGRTNPRSATDFQNERAQFERQYSGSGRVSLVSQDKTMPHAEYSY